MFRETLSSAGKKAQYGSQSRATIRKVDHSTIFPHADMDVTKGESPKAVPIVQPYGFAYWPKSQSEEQGGQQQQQTSSIGSGGDTGAGGTTGPGVMADAQQPKGKSAIGHTNYANATRSDPSAQNLQDPRHQLMLEDPKQDQQQQGGQQGGGGQSGGGQSGGGKKYGGKEGDTALYRTSDPDNIQQFHLTAEGPRLSSVKKFRYQLVPEEKSDASSSGGGQSGNQQGGQQQQSEGQRPAFQRETDAYMEWDPESKKATMRYGNGHVTITDKAMTMHYKDETISHRVTDTHAHMRFQGNTLWVDAAGCHASSPITIVPDPD